MTFRIESDYPETSDYPQELNNSSETLIKKKSSWLAKIKKQFALGNLDVFVLFLAVVAVSYLAFKEPIMFSMFAVGGFLFYSLNWLFNNVPIFGKKIGINFKLWHFAVVLSALTMLVSTFDMPAHAIFLDKLETFVGTIVTGAGTGSGITTGIVAMTFNLIRAIFLLLVAVAALFAYNQAQQGSDWRPIATQIGMAFGIVIGIDVITTMFIN